MILPITTQPAQVRAVNADFDFGTVSVLDVPYEKHVFTYTNPGKAPITIVRLQPSCHCTSGAVEGSHDDPVHLPLTIKPGQTVSIQATIDLSEEPSGPMTRLVSVFVKGSEYPVAVYTLDGVLESDAQLTPQVLDFGSMPAGQDKALLLTAKIDSRLLHGAFPSVTCDNPAIEIAPEATGDQIVAPFAAKRAGSMVVRFFEVTVPADSPLGAIQGDVSFTPPDGVSGLAERELNAATAVLTGNVTGAVTADHYSIAFNVIPLGKEAQQQIVLTGNTPADLVDITAVASSPFLSAALGPMPFPPAGSTVSTPTTRTLTIIVHKDAAVGLFNYTVTVTLANGQRIVIPVNGYVTASSTN